MFAVCDAVEGVSEGGGGGDFEVKHAGITGRAVFKIVRNFCRGVYILPRWIDGVGETED